ncbi:MAG: hypothetical protein M1839_009355 [Geoglossum umbratile]|nr:MAG: hypothetical protein M1839_009355 [Geoglossum umbratile]
MASSWVSSRDPASQLAPQPFSLTSVLSLSAVACIVLTAYYLSQVLLPRKSSRKIQFLFMWHMFDAILHSTLEASFLYHTFFSWAPVPTPEDLPFTKYYPLPMTPPGVFFLSQPSRLYGTFYGSSPMAALWQEYARADHRAGGADLTTVSMELLCVFVMGPLALYVCHLLRTEKYAKAWFWMVFIASGELYGNFMTFAPEWLTGSPNLNTSNFMYFWFYLLFFNAGLWVVIPCWTLWEAYHAIGSAFANSKDNKAAGVLPKKEKI